MITMWLRFLDWLLPSERWVVASCTRRHKRWLCELVSKSGRTVWLKTLSYVEVGTPFKSLDQIENVAPEDLDKVG